jgi:hypothetical protein
MANAPSPCRRGTSNSNERGSSEARRRRREWLVKTYRADLSIHRWDSEIHQMVPQPTCRCYRCGCLLTVDTVTVDRIIPGCKGGKYRRDNIRPACGRCNSETGGALSHEKKRKKS